MFSTFGLRLDRSSVSRFFPSFFFFRGIRSFLPCWRILNFLQSLENKINFTFEPWKNNLSVKPQLDTKTIFFLLMIEFTCLGSKKSKSRQRRLRKPSKNRVVALIWNIFQRYVIVFTIKQTCKFETRFEPIFPKDSLHVHTTYARYDRWGTRSTRMWGKGRGQGCSLDMKHLIIIVTPFPLSKTNQSSARTRHILPETSLHILSTVQISWKNEVWILVFSL